MAEEIAQEGLQINAAVEAVGEGTEVLASVLCESEGFVGTTDQGLEVAQDRVDPGELRHFARQALTHHAGLPTRRPDVIPLNLWSKF